INGPRAAIGPPKAPENTVPSFSACWSEAAASMNTPRRQLPSLITFGVSARAATVSPPTSVPSTSPLSTWKTSMTLQRSRVAGRANDTVQGQTTSQEQVSMYDPASFQDMSSPPPVDNLLGIIEMGREEVNPPMDTAFWRISGSYLEACNCQA